MKETIKDIDKAFEKKGKKMPFADYSKRLTEIQEEQWRLDQEINSIGNQAWRLRCKKLSFVQQKIVLENEKTQIFIKIGKRHIAPLTKEEKDAITKGKDIC